eukprot:6469352-Amphidinium_carterae.1
MKLGFVRSKLDAGLYIDYDRQMFIVVHVDDIIILGSAVHRDEVVSALRVQFDMKHEQKLDEPKDCCKLLGRALLKTEKGFQLLNDPKHVWALMEELGLTESTKGAVSPYEKDPEGEIVSELDVSEASRMRRCIGQLMWVAQDRADIKFAVSMVAADAAKPTSRTVRRVK